MTSKASCKGVQASQTPARRQQQDQLRRRILKTVSANNVGGNGIIQKNCVKAAPQAAKTTYVPKLAAAMRSYFAPLRTAQMDTEERNIEGENSAEEHQQVPSLVAGRPHPIVLTSAVNLILLQKQKGW
jgi:hypothetical protein